MFSLVSRSIAGVNLAPAERAVLKLGKTFLFGLIALAFANLGPIEAWIAARGLPPAVAQAVIVLLTAIVAAWDKYQAAQADEPLTTTVSLTPAGQAVVAASSNTPTASSATVNFTTPDPALLASVQSQAPAPQEAPSTATDAPTLVSIPAIAKNAPTPTPAS